MFRAKNFPFEFKDMAKNEFTEVKEKRILAAWIEEVDQLGKVTVVLNQTLNEFLLRKDWFDERTFEFTLESSSDAPKDKLGFLWECTSFEQLDVSAKFEFQVNFTNAVLVSSGEEADLLKIRFVKRVFF